MSLHHALLDALRVAVVLGLALAAMPLLRRASAASRRLLLALAIGGALFLPAVAALAPAWPLGYPSLPPAAAPVAEPLSEAGPLTAAAAPLHAPEAATPPVLAATAARSAAPALAVVWALGALLVAARLVVGLARARALVRRASPAPSWARAVAQAERSTGARADVRTTDDLDAPAVTGVLHPVVLVPRASESWPDERRTAVLLHELAHVAQRDCLVQILAQIACALHWFDPLAWLAARRLRRERELSADDAVIAAGIRPTTYAEALLAIAGAHAAPVGAVGMADGSDLAARITAVVAPGRARRPPSRPRAALLAVGAAAVLLIVACASPEPRASSTATAPVPPPRAAVGPASTLDPRLQRIAEEELARTMDEWRGASGAVLVLDPATGEILADAGRVGGAPADVALGRAFVTGSTLKTVTLAAALEEGVVTPADRFDCENGARAYGALVLHDAGAYGTLTVPEMLAVSTNIGFSKVFDRLGGDRLARWLARFHFGAAPGIDGAVAGDAPGPIEDRSFQGAVVANGEQIKASPLQVAAAYAAIANDGTYLPPTLVRRAAPAQGEPILKPETAHTLVAMLEGVVNGERGTGKAARLPGVRVAGKTGTADLTRPDGTKSYYASFVGIVPAVRPRFVILVGVEAPRDEGTGGQVAAPAFARIASRALGG
jgi:beta-lactamase regulating signal transducer with metallopeptidase domain